MPTPKDVESRIATLPDALKPKVSVFFVSSPFEQIRQVP